MQVAIERLGECGALWCTLQHFHVVQQSLPGMVLLLTHMVPDVCANPFAVGCRQAILDRL